MNAKREIIATLLRAKRPDLANAVAQFNIVAADPTLDRRSYEEAKAKAMATVKSSIKELTKMQNLSFSEMFKDTETLSQELEHLETLSSRLLRETDFLDESQAINEAKKRLQTARQDFRKVYVPLFDGIGDLLDAVKEVGSQIA